MGYFIRISLKLLLLFILVIINLPMDILSILSIYLFNRSLVYTKSDVLELFNLDVEELNDEEFEFWLNKLLLVAVRSALVFYITTALIIIPIL